MMTTDWITQQSTASAMATNQKTLQSKATAQQNHGPSEQAYYRNQEETEPEAKKKRV